MASGAAHWAGGVGQSSPRGEGGDVTRIAVVAGDGIGPEVVAQARKVLDAYFAAEGYVAREP